MCETLPRVSLVAWGSDPQDPPLIIIRPFALALIAAIVLALTALPTRAQDTSPDLARVEQLVRAAHAALGEFRAHGGKDGDPGHPGAEWAARLWPLRSSSTDRDAAALATAEALHLLVHAGRFDEVSARVRALVEADPAWPQVWPVLDEAARLSGDGSLIEETGARLLTAYRDPLPRAELRLVLAKAAADRGDRDTARRHYQSALDAAPGSNAAATAEGALYELASLQPGHTAPLFVATARDGSTVSLAALRGHPTLIIFWASW